MRGLMQWPRKRLVRASRNLSVSVCVCAVEHCVVAKSRRGSFLPAGLVLVLSGSTLRSSGARADYCMHAVVLEKAIGRRVRSLVAS